ncbi:hypothetical protein [Spirosoma utsteinense]|uniref:hypothetical protein n=1 Tax=Spirosoma utsteinense TaxID=2585773 RepID=UPI001647BE30|nr:hypothetical protein [Spirosoma utsteinense]MBC3785708.1 hypothetical protein [Spirosoma utsteinense]
MALTDNIFCEDCIDDICAAAAFPVAIDYAAHCEESNDDLISEIFFTDQAHPLTADPAIAGSWAPRLSNTTTTGNPIRSILVPKFTKPRVDGAVKTSIDGNRSKLIDVDRTITGLIDDDSDEMYDLMKTLQCNGNVLFWYRAGKHIYGGQSGIKGSMRPAYGIVDEDGFAHKWGLTIGWRAKCEEPRVLAAI